MQRYKLRIRIYVYKKRFKTTLFALEIEAKNALYWLIYITVW